MNERGGSIILPWPNTKANIRKVVCELQVDGWSAKIVTTDHETYVSTNAPMGHKR